MLLPQARETAIVAGLGRPRGADEIRALTPAINFVRPGKFVPRRRLPCDPKTVVERASRIDTALAGVGLVEPLRRIERVLVHKHRGVVLDLVVPCREPEPDAVAPQRPAEGCIEIPVVLHRVRRAEAGVLEPLREVA